METDSYCHDFKKYTAELKEKNILDWIFYWKSYSTKLIQCKSFENPGDQRKPKTK